MVRIGELSRQTGVSIRSLRYYEEKGLLRPQRCDNGYRVYEAADVKRVEGIRYFLTLGMSTEEVAIFIDCLALEAGLSPSCATEAIALYEQKLKQTQEQIKALTQVESHLQQILAEWRRIKQEEE